MKLSWITGGKPDHPMSDMKKARELVAELPADDSFKSVEEATSWLDSIDQTEGFKLDHRLSLIDLLDQATKNHQQKLAQEYLAAPRLQKFRENRLWNTAFEFWKKLGTVYLRCIEQFQAGASGSGAVKKDLPLAVGRALQALTMQLKWILLRYGRIEDRIWRDLGRAYLFAESQGFATLRAKIYPGPHGQSSAQEEFLTALMLAMSSPDNLVPTRLRIAERIVAHFGSRFTLQAKAAPGCNFFFDLSMHKPPARVHKGMAPGPMVRFFGAGEAEQGLRDLIRAVHEKDGVPSDVNLGGQFDKETVLSVLTQLELYWAGKPPARSSERRELAMRVTVVPGFPGIVSWIEAFRDASPLEFSDPEQAESWIVSNVSDGGYGAIVPQVKGDWLQMGRLLGLRHETAKSCGVGIVRRITRDEYDQRRVGIQVLNKIAIPVRVSPGDSVATLSANRQGASAVLLSNKPDKNGVITLLLHVGSFTPKHSLVMRVRDKVYLLLPSELVEEGEDFDWARFKVTKQL